MPVVPPRRRSSAARPRLLVALLLGVGLLALTACGSSSNGASSSASASSADARDTARVKLQQCLRKQGIEVPGTPGNGGGTRPQLSTADRTKLQQALQGTCKQYANGAFGQISDDQRQEFQDAFTKFSACMRKQGIDVPTPQPGGAGGGPPAGGSGRFDQNDPKVQAAAKSCQSLLPQGGRGGPGGGGAPGGN